MQGQNRLYFFTEPLILPSKRVGFLTFIIPNQYNPSHVMDFLLPWSSIEESYYLFYFLCGKINRILQKNLETPILQTGAQYWLSRGISFINLISSFLIAWIAVPCFTSSQSTRALGPSIFQRQRSRPEDLQLFHDLFLFITSVPIPSHIQMLKTF